MASIAICLEMIYEDRPLADRFAPVSDLGAPAVEFWHWWDYDLDRLATQSERAGLDIVAVSANDAALTDPATADAAVEEITDSIEAARRIDCPRVIVLAGPDQADLDRSAQRESVVSVLSTVAPAAERAGVTCVLEPLNTVVDHPGHFLQYADEAFSFVDAVGSPAVKVLFDIYHQQVTEGNIIQTITANLEAIDHLHAADVPGRHEPGTGELHYGNIIQAVEAAGYDGHVGFEFTPQTESDTAVRSIVDRFGGDRSG